MKSMWCMFKIVACIVPYRILVHVIVWYTTCPSECIDMLKWDDGKLSSKLKVRVYRYVARVWR